jgi:hypothetical protein
MVCTYEVGSETNAHGEIILIRYKLKMFRKKIVTEEVILCLAILRAARSDQLFRKCYPLQSPSYDGGA